MTTQLRLFGDPSPAPSARVEVPATRLRPVIRQLWQEAPYPADPVYLLDMLHRIETGAIDIDNPPWRFTAEDLAKMAAFRARFPQERIHA